MAKKQPSVVQGMYEVGSDSHTHCNRSVRLHMPAILVLVLDTRRTAKPIARRQQSSIDR